MAADVHEGHRERVKRRFAREGLSGFEDHEILELLLFYAIPQGDVNPLAHRLTETFGSLDGVLSASAEALARVPGVGPHTASLLTLMKPLAAETRRRAQAEVTAVRKASDAEALAQRLLQGGAAEETAVILLGPGGRVLVSRKLSSGSVGAVDLPMAEILELTARVRPMGVILAHSHPAGKASPSDGDDAATARLAEALTYLGVPLEDHVIVGEEETFSYRAAGRMPR